MSVRVCIIIRSEYNYSLLLISLDDERWMQNFDVPRLHSILDSYLKSVKKTKWMEKIGKSLQSKLLRSILSNTIKRHSSSSILLQALVKIVKLLKNANLKKVKGGPVDDGMIQPRMDISFWNLVPCYSIHTEPGLCLSTAICSAIGGTPSGSCMHRMSISKTCCIINSKKLKFLPKNSWQSKLNLHF